MPEIWKILFDRAIKQLDQAGIKKQHWSLGGGTVLRMYYNHRESKDIDIFFHDQQLLAYISPRTNDANEDYLLTYAEGSVFTKIIFPEGEVDFIF